MSDGPLLNRKQAANYLTERGYPISAKTLQNLASVATARKGPPFSKVPRGAMYNPAELEDWRKRNTRRVE